MCAFLYLYVQDSANAWGNNLSDYIIQSKESWWKKIGQSSREKTQPARDELARVGSSAPCWALHGGNACQTHYMMPQVTDASQQSSPCLTATNNE